MDAPFESLSDSGYKCSAVIRDEATKSRISRDEAEWSRISRDEAERSRINRDEAKQRGAVKTGKFNKENEAALVQRFLMRLRCRKKAVNHANE